MNLYSDPSAWNSDEITAWLKWCTKKFQLKQKPVRSRLPNTGTELVKLSKAEFWVCADGYGKGGNKLAQHIGLKIYEATGQWEETLLSEIEPCK